MPKRYSSRETIRAIEKLGFFFVRQKGSHMVFRKKSGEVVVIVARKKEIPPGTFSKILRDVNLTLEEFKSLL